MLRHLLRLVWNRKRSSLLLLTEMFFSFVVLFGVGTVLINVGRNYLLPRGFEYADVWRLNIAAGQGQKMPRPVLDDVLRQVRMLPGVKDVALTSPNTPFSFLTIDGNFQRGDRVSRAVDRHDADDDYAQTLGLHLREGRWFRTSDDATTRRPAVISQRMREQLFGPGERALGQVFGPEAGPGVDSHEKFVVVGVADEVRTKGDFAYPEPSAWLRLVPHDTTGWESAAVLVKVAPGQGAALQQRIVHTVAGLTRQWTTEVRPLNDDRLTQLRVTLAPLGGLSLVGIFLIVNVALGLFGMLWLNINQRRAELGVRRAMGATAGAISRQVLGEILVLTTFGLLLGLLVAAQFPLLGVLDVPAGVYLTAMALAAAGLYALATVCALYPSRLAAAIQPAVALREE